MTPAIAKWLLREAKHELAHTKRNVSDCLDMYRGAKHMASGKDGWNPEIWKDEPENALGCLREARRQLTQIRLVVDDLKRIAKQGSDNG